jgi:predicted CopG family antitoxin
MAVKTITIDVEAYEVLARHKRKGQSFSRVIKEHFGGRKTGRDLKRALQEARLAEQTIDAIERQIQSRRLEPARAAKL